MLFFRKNWELFAALGLADKARAAFTKASKLSTSPKQKQKSNSLNHSSVNRLAQH